MGDIENSEHNVILNYIYNAYTYLEDLLIIKEYEINSRDDWIIKSKNFLLRYRRIIGIVMLSIVIYLALYCEPIELIQNNAREESVQKGGAGLEFGSLSFSGSPEANQKRVANEKEAKAKEARKQKALTKKREQNEIKSAYDKEKKDKANAEVKQKATADAAQKELERKAYKSMSSSDKAKLQAGQKLSEFKETKTGKTLGKFAGKSGKGKAAMITKGLGSGAYKVGAYVGETAKEYSQIFYQILFAVVITVCILMIFLPSLSFFFLGLVCYFLLKKKMANLKMF